MATPNKITDTHSHILPGIDDGAKTLTNSADIVRELAEQGVTNIIATPHYVNETIYSSPYSENKKLLKELQKHLAKEGIKVNIYLGNEIYIDPAIPDLIKHHKVTPLAGSKYLLVEFPLDNEYPNYEDYFRVLIDQGYKVVLAHPERYTIIQKDYQIAKDLRDLGVLFQCNYGSIVGKYGKRAKKLVKKFAKDKMIFIFGSDMHRARGEYLIDKAVKKLSKYYSSAELKTLLQTNPSKIFTF